MKTASQPAWLLQPLSLLVFLVLSVTTARATGPDPAALPADANGDFSGTVVETMNTAGYTYVQVDTGSQKVWAATTHFAVNKGDNVTVIGGMPMAGFHSKSLNRDFDVIYFSGKIALHLPGANVPEKAPALPPGHPALPDQASPALPPNHPPVTDLAAPARRVDLTGIKKAEGGSTVQEIIAGSARFAGQPVKVRGKVVRYNAMVMGKNWLHIQDGSGSADKKDNDLTVTTAMPAKLGDTVLVTGNIATDRDFGAGYRYSVVLEDARITIE
jgi:hypothetical protein